MSRQQEELQIKYKYLFIITPIEIKTSTKIKINNNKTILIKLGNKTGKCSQINTPIQLEIDVLYSKTLQKYCPIKGIIKIYDVSEDGSEIISCVGAFQTDQILNQGKNKVIIQKEIGTSRLKMDINIVNLSQKKSEDKNQIFSKTSSSSQRTSSKERFMIKKDSSDKVSSNIGRVASPRDITASLVLNDGKRVNNFLQSDFSHSKKEIPYKNTSSSINKSLEKINQALNFKRFEETGPKVPETHARTQFDKAKQLLNDEKLKNTKNQDKLQKITLKLLNTKSILTYYHNQLKSYLEKSKKIISTVQLKDGKLISETNDTKICGIKVKDKEFQKNFKEYIEFIQIKITQTLPNFDIDIQGNEKEKTIIEIEQYKRELSILKKLTIQKDKKITTLQKQLEGIQTTLNNLKESNKHLNEQNHYLRQKNDQIELSIYHKESTIDSLRKQIDKYNYELQEIENKLYNGELESQELKEEIFNCNQIIENYREKYGDLKNVKNRAIEMEIKECIRWIDQQDRDLELSQMEQTMQTDRKDESHDKSHDNLSSVIRNIEIQKAPLQEMSIIRMQLIKILEKVDNLMAK